MKQSFTFLLLVPCVANFLGKQGIHRSLLEQLEDVLGKDQVTQARIGQLEEALRPSFQALPKTGQTIGAPAARYALQRLFLQLHGWQMKGLDLRGDWSQASPVEALAERVPPTLRDLFEDRLGDRGLDLHELAVMAATLEKAVRNEANDRLRVCYGALGYKEDTSLKYTSALAVMEIYMASWLIGGEVANLSKTEVLWQSQSMSDHMYPRWSLTKLLLQGVADELITETFDFTTIGSILGVVADRFFHLENQQCQLTKSTLISMEEIEGNGRVRLGDFYRPVLDGSWHEFGESTDFLRQLGALDESNPRVERVIIPNYILAPSNCVADSGFYAVCCMNECEGLMSQLEAKIQAPSASPAEVLKLVSAMPSESQPSNRTLSRELRNLLHDVAEHHGGDVPLHGRLFAQWMHHAYPRECPFPHSSSTVKEYEPQASLLQPGRAARDEMVKQIEKPWNTTVTKGLCSNMWTFEEQLVGPETHKMPSPSHWLISIWERVHCHTPFGAAAVASSIVFLMKMASGSNSGMWI